MAIDWHLSTTYIKVHIGNNKVQMIDTSFVSGSSMQFQLSFEEQQIALYEIISTLR